MAVVEATTTGPQSDAPLSSVSWPDGCWTLAFVKQLVEEIRKLAISDGENGAWQAGSESWEAVEAIYKKYLEKNGGKLEGASKFFRKANGLRDVYMKTYPCDQAALNGFLDAIVIRDNDTHAILKRDMIESFRGSEGKSAMDTNRFRYLHLEKYDKTGAYAGGVPEDDVVVQALKKAPWSVKQYKCLAEHPEWSKERYAKAKAKSESSAALSSAVDSTVLFGGAIVEVMVQIATSVCDEVGKMKRYGALEVATPQLRELIVDIIYLCGPCNLCGRPQDLTPGQALCDDGETVAKTRDEAITVDSDGLCACIHWINKTKMNGTKSACVLPPAVVQRLFGCLGDVWTIAMPLYSANCNWATETMSGNSGHFKSHSRWAPLWNQLALGDKDTFTAYNLKHLSVNLLKRVFVMNDTDKAIETLQMIQCNHKSGDATCEYKTVRFAPGAEFTVDRRLFLDGDGQICVAALTGESSVSPVASSSSDTDDSEPMANGGLGDSLKLKRIQATKQAIEEVTLQRPAKRIKVSHSMIEVKSYCNYLKKKEKEGCTLVYE